MSMTLTASTVSNVSEGEITLEIARLRRDGGTQSRAELDVDTISDYANAMKAGAKFPAVDAHYDGINYWLVDGFHRIEAALEVNLKTFQVIVHQGTLRDAILYSVGANAIHGLRRKNVDKRRAVVRLLSDAEWSQWSRNQIAKQCGVDEKLVRDIQEELSSELPKIDSQSAKKYGIDEKTLKEAQQRVKETPTRRKVQRGGKTYTLDTTKIGQHKKRETSTTSTSSINQSKLPLAPQETEVLLPRVRQTVIALHKQELPNSQEIESTKEAIVQPITEIQEDTEQAWWQLGKIWLFNGHPTAREFQERIKLKQVMFSIILSPWEERFLENPHHSQGAILKYSASYEDVDWEIVCQSLQGIFAASCSSDDFVVLYFLPIPDFLILADREGGRCFIAEPDRDRCVAAVEAWRKEEEQNKKINF